MRLTTLVSVAVLAVSSAALAQIGTTPTEQKGLTNADAADAKVPANTAAGVDTDADDMSAAAAANDTLADNGATPGNSVPAPRPRPR